MLAFRSSSLPKDNEYVVSQLISKLNEQGFDTTSGAYYFSDTIDEESIFKMRGAHLFIGILMHTTLVPTPLNRQNQRVINEWEYAVSRKIPALLLVENTIQLDTSLSNPDNIVVIDKYNPEKAVAFAQKSIQEARQSLDADKINMAAWLLGGDSLIALIGFVARAVQREKAMAA